MAEAVNQWWWSDRAMFRMSERLDGATLGAYREAVLKTHTFWDAVVSAMPMPDVAWLLAHTGLDLDSKEFGADVPGGM